MKITIPNYASASDVDPDPHYGRPHGSEYECYLNNNFS